jgi:hypothetical protein
MFGELVGLRVARRLAVGLLAMVILVGVGASGARASFTSVFYDNSSANLSADPNPFGGGVPGGGGFSNVVIGLNSLEHVSSGSGNVAAGVSALATDTSGDQNVANGWSALFDNTTGSDNVATGFEALFR